MDGQTQEEYSVRNWNRPVEKWSQGTVIDYVVWLKDTYGEEEAKKFFARANEYRAVKDVMVVEPIYKQPTTILTSKAIADAALKILEEELKISHEYNKP